MRRRLIDQRGKTERAFQAYVELMDAAERLRNFMARKLETFDLTMVQFRVLEMVYHKGPRYQEAISRRLGCSKQNIRLVLDRLERAGWIKRVKARLPATQAAGTPAKKTADRPAKTSEGNPANKLMGRRIF
jgi:predicted ATP-grasp superfamily ATP-dependent carboligase